MALFSCQQKSALFSTETKVWLFSRFSLLKLTFTVQKYEINFLALFSCELKKCTFFNRPLKSGIFKQNSDFSVHFSLLKLTFSASSVHSGMFSKVLLCFENVGRQDDLANFWHFLTWFQSFFQPNWLYLGLKASIGSKNDSIHVRKCQKLTKSSCRPMFSRRNKTLQNIPLCSSKKYFLLKNFWNSSSLKKNGDFVK